MLTGNACLRNTNTMLIKGKDVPFGELLPTDHKRHPFKTNVDMRVVHIILTALKPSPMWLSGIHPYVTFDLRALSGVCYHGAILESLSRLYVASVVCIMSHNVPNCPKAYSIQIFGILYILLYPLKSACNHTFVFMDVTTKFISTILVLQSIPSFFFQEPQGNLTILSLYANQNPPKHQLAIESLSSPLHLVTGDTHD